MISFEHGALQRQGEPLLAGILAYGVLESPDAQAITFLTHAEAQGRRPVPSALYGDTLLHHSAQHVLCTRFQVVNEPAGRRRIRGT